MFIMSRSNTGVQQVNEHDYNYGTDTGGVILSRSLGDGFSVGARLALGGFRVLPLTYQSDRLFNGSFAGRIVPVVNDIFVRGYSESASETGFKIPSFTAIPFEYICNHRYKIELTFENLDCGINQPSTGYNAYWRGQQGYFMKLVYILTGARLVVGSSVYSFGGAVSSYDFRHIKIISRIPEEGIISEEGYNIDASEVVGVWGIIVYTPMVDNLIHANSDICIGSLSNVGSSGISSMSSLNVVSEQFMPNNYSGFWELGAGENISIYDNETQTNIIKRSFALKMINDDILTDVALNGF